MHFTTATAIRGHEKLPTRYLLNAEVDDLSRTTPTTTHVTRRLSRFLHTAPEPRMRRCPVVPGAAKYLSTAQCRTRTVIKLHSASPFRIFKIKCSYLFKT